MKKSNNKKLFIVLIIIIVLIIVLYFLTKDNKSNEKNVFMDNYLSNLVSQDITTKIDGCNIDEVLKNNKVPYFRLDNQLYKDINQEILTNFFLRACYQNGNVDYNMSINDNILSLVLTISYEEADDASYLEYKTYNIDLNTNSKISNTELLNKYNIDTEKADKIFISKLNDYYNYEKNKRDEKLSFSQFLQEIDYVKITNDNINLYIDEYNNLYFYKTYNYTRLMALDENYPEVITKFKLN